MKFNWGTGIFLFYTVFVLFFVVLVYKSTQRDNSLVFEDYYAKDIAYQQHYNKLKNNQLLDEDIAIKTIAPQKTVELKYPEDINEMSGEIVFFCPSDSKQDFTVAVAPEANKTQVISTDGLKKGLWKLRINWEGDGTEFYREETVIF